MTIDNTFLSVRERKSIKVCTISKKISTTKDIKIDEKARAKKEKKNAITHVTSEYQHADFLTKAISRESFELHRDFVMNLQ